jgi:heat shock protein HslJ
MQKSTRWLLLAWLLILAACANEPVTQDVAQEPATIEQVFYVAPFTELCGDVECLLVRDTLAEQWQQRPNNIEGFVYEAGYTYKLRVAQISAEDSTRFVLVDQLSREGSFENPATTQSTETLQTWYLDYMLTNAVALDTEITLQFGESTIIGTGGCNEYRAGYTTGSTETIVIDTIDATRQMCSELVSQQERDFFDALAMISHYEQSDSGTLIFKDLSGQPILTFVTSR